MREPTDNLVEIIYAELRQRLQQGAILPSERLVDTQIAKRYGTSRMPAREALLRLAAEGFLAGTTRGFAMRELSLDDIAGLFEVRRQLEPRAAASAARDMTDEIQAELSAAMVRIEASLAKADVPSLLSANVDFRNAWLKAVRNRHMAGTVSRLMNYFQAVRFDSFADAATAKHYIDGLSRIHAAFLARDPLMVEERMLLFMFAAEEAFLAVRRRQLEAMEKQKSSRRKSSRKAKP